MNVIRSAPDKLVARIRQRRAHRGVAMLELALVMPVLIMLLLGVIELGRVMMMNQMVTNACREGCRRAVVPGSTHDAVIDIVEGYLDATGISETGRQIQLMDSSGNAAQLEDIPAHEPVTIRVQVPYSGNTWGLISIFGGKALASEATMRRE